MAVRGGQRCKSQLDRLSSALPEVAQRSGGEKGLHVAYVVRSKTFAYFTEDHHGDGRLARMFHEGGVNTGG
jgi:hypothetical protein